jgi:DNA-binding NtrC family response regulator
VTARPKILIVDDEAPVRQALAMTLASFADVIVAGGALEALARLAHEPCDVVLTDYGMSGGDGCWLLEAVRAAHPGVKRLLMSGDCPEVSVGVDQTVQAMLQKPFAEHEVWAALLAVGAREP